jgi:hypothetical protein
MVVLSKPRKGRRREKINGERESIEREKEEVRKETGKIEKRGKHKRGSTTGSNCGMITPAGCQESIIS